MKTTIKIFVSLLLIAGLSACGVNRSWTVNQNERTTQVLLGSNNFKVVGQVKGTADVEYVLIFGGRKDKELYHAAYADMLKNTDLSSGSRAVTNILTEEQLGGAPPFWYKRTVTVSATIIEFLQ